MTTDQPTLRDRFAMAALPTMLRMMFEDNPTDIAKDAYQMADAMLEARKEQEPQYPWNAAPEWAQWAGMDSDGEVFWCEEKPELKDRLFWIKEGGRSEFCRQEPHRYYWRESLEARP